MSLILIDTSALTHTQFLIPGVTPEVVDGRPAALLMLEPGTYAFQQQSGSFADFTFRVTPAGTVDYDSSADAFLSGRGSTTLTVAGLQIALDITRLSHALLPTVFGARILARDRVHALVVVPAPRYSFISASGVSTDFSFVVETDGTVTVDPRFAGFAEAAGRTLMLKGYRVTLDTRNLSHALLPLLLDWSGDSLSPGRHDITVMPGNPGYSFVSASGVVADFTFMVRADGAVIVDPRFAGFVEVNLQMLSVKGYRISLDTGELTHHVQPALLGWTGGSLRPGVNEFVVIPGANYPLQVLGSESRSIRFDVGVDGKTALIQAIPGMTLMSDSRMCAVPDTIETPLQIQTYGSPGGRWSRGQLTFSIDLTNAPDLGTTNGVPNVVVAISTAFAQWQAVFPAFFNFSMVPANGDIRVVFGGKELNPRFGTAGGVAGSAPFPEAGRLEFDRFQDWTLPQSSFFHVALHEIGHALGLKHSDSRASLMFPSTTGLTTIDEESKDALRNLYGWRPQTVLADRATSDRPSLAVSTRVNFTSSFATLHMVWRGVGADQSIYESNLDNNAWTPQRLITGIASSQSPSITSFPLNDGTPSTGLIMAWKGAGEDGRLYFSTNRGTGWTPQANVPNVASSHRPALGDFGVTHMAWKGLREDQGIYWSRLSMTGWEPQRRIDGVGTSAAPALVFFRNRLFMFWKGAGDDRRVFFSSLDTGSTLWQPQRLVAFQQSVATGTVFVNIGTSNAPSATQHGDRILLAWKGIPDDSGIYFSLFDGNAFTGQIRVANVGTSQGPGVCRLSGATHMAWKGAPDDDNRIYWSVLGS